MIFFTGLIFLLFLLFIMHLVRLRDNQIFIFDFFAACSIFFLITISYYNGVDWVSYNSLYEGIVSGENYNNPYEPFFYYFYQLVVFFSVNFYFSIVVYFFFIVLLLWWIAIIIKVPLSLVGFVVLLFFYFDLFSDAIRQAFSLVLCLLATVYILKNKFTFGMVVFSIAFFFHYSSIAFSLYFLVCYYFSFYAKVKYMKMFSFLFIFVGFVIIPLVLNDFRYFIGLIFNGDVSNLRLIGNLIEASKSGAGSYGFFIVFDILFILISSFKIVSSRSGQMEVFLYGGILASAVLHFNFYLFPLLQRVTQYYYIFHCVFIFMSYKGVVNCKKYTNFIILISLFIFSFLFLYKNITREFRSDYLFNPLIYEIKVL